MLQVTDTAALAVKSFLEDERTQGSALRLELSAPDDGSSSPAIRFTPVEAPAPGDVLAEAADVDIFVSSDLSDPLSDALLDARVTPEGTELVLRTQET